MFGPQRESQRQSAPAWSVGTGSRAQFAKIFVPGMQRAADPGTPGATYQANASSRPGSASTPGCGFGARTGKRNPPDRFQDRMWSPSPGPALCPAFGGSSSSFGSGQSSRGQSETLSRSQTVHSSLGRQAPPPVHVQRCPVGGQGRPVRASPDPPTAEP